MLLLLMELLRRDELEPLPDDLEELEPLRPEEDPEPYSAPNSSMPELLLIELVRLAALLPLREALLPDELDPDELPRLEEEEAYSAPNSSLP